MNFLLVVHTLNPLWVPHLKYNLRIRKNIVDGAMEERERCDMWSAICLAKINFLRVNRKCNFTIFYSWTFFLFLFLRSKKGKVKYAIPVFEVRWTGSLYPSFSGNRLYVVVCHCFPYCFTSLSLNRLSYSFVTSWVGMGAPNTATQLKKNHLEDE